MSASIPGSSFDVILVQQLDAGHDPSGNPQRIWTIYKTVGARVTEPVVLDEGYSGRRILLADLTMDEYRAAHELAALKITKQQYRWCRAIAAKGGRP